MSALSSIHQNPELQVLAKANGVSINYVSWEDSSRPNSQNITDMTLVVDKLEMPVIRKANTSDETVKLAIAGFSVVVGNETGSPLRTIPLSEYLSHLDTYSNNPHLTSFLIQNEQVVTSSQHCILPDNSEFAVKLYNHQTRDEDPAVLVVMASDQGTSCQVLHGRGEELYFNQNGRAVKMSARRDEAKRDEANTSASSSSLPPITPNTLFIFQIPLKQKEVMLTRGGFFGNFGNYPTVVKTRPQNGNQPSPPPRGLSQAVLGLGREQGVYQGTKGLRLVRDTSQAIRCTIQRYSVTNEATLTPSDIRSMADQIHQLLDTGDSYVKVV